MTWKSKVFMNIKMCPKCGQSGKVHKLWNGFLNMEIYQVSCSNYCKNIGWYTTKDNAVKAWNQQAEIESIIVAGKDEQ